MALFDELHTVHHVPAVACRIARRLGALTPAELYSKQLGSRAVGVALFLVFTIYTLPYMATAEGAARWPHAGPGCHRITPYAGRGVGLAATPPWAACAPHGPTCSRKPLPRLHAHPRVRPARGFDAIFENPSDGAQLERPETGLYSGAALASWSLVISLTVVCFPHMLVRLVAARSEAGLRRVCILYPLALVALWLPAVLLGLFGRAAFPGLEGRESDRVFNLLVEDLAPPGSAPSASSRCWPP